jgi:hypothetical protein
MTPPLPQVFRAAVVGIREKSPADCLDWRLEDKNGACELVIPKLSDDGFEVIVIADDCEVTVYSEHIAHQHFTSDGNHEEVCQLALGLVRDLLSPAMRLRVIEVGGKPSRAHFEISRDGVWRRDGTTVLFSLPFFRKRVERFYTNRRLPIRKSPNSESWNQPVARANAHDCHASCGAGGAPAVGVAHL